MDDIEELYHLFPEIKSQIIIEKKVGQGTFSYVYVGRFVLNENEKVALKYIIPTSSPSRTKQEIECLLNIGGRENVVGVLSVLRNKSHILIFMPYVEHVSFHDVFIYWNLDEIREYIKNLLIALNRVHQCGIIHRDVKPSNFLYDHKQKIFALVDFGLAQAYDKTCENIFEYEKSKKQSSNVPNENTPIRKNLIALTPSKRASSSISATTNSASNALIHSSSTSHLVLTNPKTPASQTRTDLNSLPEILKKDKTQITNSFSFESNLNMMNDIKSPPSNTPTIAKNNLNNHVTNINSPRVKASPNLQKYYSFQKPSYSFSDTKCNCFNMPFVCEICTSRSTKWAPRAGTAGFRAPEVLFRSTHQTPAVDVWSAGIILLSILSGCYPFFKAVDDNMAIMQLISLFGYEPVRKAAYKYGESILCSNEKNQMDLKDICQSLRTNVKARLESSHKNKPMEKEAFTTIIEEFPDTAYDLLKKLLELDCNKRISAENALRHPFFTESS